MIAKYCFLQIRKCKIGHMVNSLVKTFDVITAGNYFVFPNRIGHLFLWMISGRRMSSITNAMMRHSGQSCVMLVMLSIFSILKSMTPIIMRWRPKMRRVPMEMRVMMRLLILLSDLAR